MFAGRGKSLAPDGGGKLIKCVCVSIGKHLPNGRNTWTRGCFQIRGNGGDKKIKFFCLDIFSGQITAKIRPTFEKIKDYFLGLLTTYYAECGWRRATGKNLQKRAVEKLGKCIKERSFCKFFEKKIWVN